MNNQSEDRVLGYVGTYPVGDYNEQTEYEYLNVVTHKGSSYVCIKEEGCIAVEPPNEECWQLFAGKGEKGEKGEKGDTGPTGPKPINGVDYNTESEQKEFKDKVVADSKADLEKYITEKEKHLDDYTKEKEKTLDNYITDTVKPKIDTYVEETTKKDIDEYEKKKETALDTYTDTKKTDLDNYVENTSKTALDEYEKEKETELETAKDTAISEFDAHAESLEKRIATLEEKQVKEYGVRYYFGQASSTLERLGDAIGLTAKATKNGTYVENDFDNVEIFKDIKLVKRDKKTHKLLAVKGDADFDDIDGEEIVDYPETYWKFKLDENKKFVDIYVRNFATTGYKKVNAFSVGAKPLSSDPDGNLQTKSGYCAKGWTSRANFRNLIKSQYGDGACLLDWRYQVILFLYLIEFADFNTQKVLGQMHSTFRFNFASDKALIEETSTNRIIIANGSFVIGQQIGIGTSDGGTQIAKERTVTSMKKYDDGTVTGYEIAFDGDPVNITTASAVMTYSQKTGSTDDIQASSGCMADDGKHGARYRYFEFNSIFDWIDGYIIKDGKIYFSNNPEDYNDTDTSKFDVLSYALSTASGWIKELGFDTNNPFCMFPTIAGNGAGSSTYITDYTWCNPKGVFAPRVSGSPNHGAYVGAFSWSLNYGASSAFWNCGARVLFDQI